MWKANDSNYTGTGTGAPLRSNRFSSPLQLYALPTAPAALGHSRVRTHTMRVPPLLLLLSFFSPGLAAAFLTQSAVLSELLVEYDATMRPSQTECSATSADHIQVQIVTDALHSIDQVSKSYALDALLLLVWSDPRLDYSTRNLSCANALTFESMDVLGIWSPKVSVPQARSISLGGGSGKMAADGESVEIGADGTVRWLRRMHALIHCNSFSFGRVPFDTQYCQMDVGVLGYSYEELTVGWLTQEAAANAGVEASLRSGEWIATLESLRSDVRVPAPLSGYRPPSLATLCFSLERSSHGADFTIVVAVLLVIASYSGFYISPAAAPARIALAFLCFLMVLNNLNSVYSKLPPLVRFSDGERVWISDFLTGTMIFNFLALIEFAAVNLGLRLVAEQRAATSTKEGGQHARITEDGHARGDEVEVGPPASATRARRAALFVVHRAKWRLTALSQLDVAMRVVFPITYGIFCTVMFSLVDQYGTNENGCVTIAN